MNNYMSPYGKRSSYGEGSDEFRFGQIQEGMMSAVEDYKKAVDEKTGEIKDPYLLNKSIKNADYYKSQIEYLKTPKEGEQTQEEMISGAMKLRPQGSMDYMASAYYAQNPVASQAKYGSSISGEMMPGAKRTEEQNKTGKNPLYSDPEFLKYIAQYGFDQYGRKIRR